MLLRSTTAVVIITLGFMNFGVWHERIVAKGSEIVATFVKRESSMQNGDV